MISPLFSIVVPVFNRPNELDELLQSLTEQDKKNFEVIVVDDGSSLPCDEVVNKYQGKIDVKYFFKANTGPGTTRNFGSEHAKGQYIIFFDSDCIIPKNYISIVTNELEVNPVDAYGGPDSAHESFTNTQKAINFAMTSFITTGGIRGKKQALDTFFPRSFNMGITKQVFIQIGGFSKMRFGEDVDLSLRVVKMGFTTRLFPKAFVYHKRRTDFRKFFRQVFNSGIARVNLSLLHPGSLKLVHLLPTAFTFGMVCCLLGSYFFPVTLALPILFSLVVFAASYYETKSLAVAFLSVPATWVQLLGYGLGLIDGAIKQLVMKKESYQAFEKNFYS